MRKSIYYLLIFVLVLIGCKQSEKTISNEDNSAIEKDSTQTTEPFTYNPKLDLYNADKEVITQLGDTLGMKLVLIEMETGEEMPRHAHPPHHSYYFFEGSKMELSSDGIFWFESPPFIPDGGIGGPTQTDPHGGMWFTIGEIPVKCIDLDIYDRSEIQTSVPFVYDAKKDYYNLKSESVIKLGDTLGVKMYILNLKPGDSLRYKLPHPKQGTYVIEGGKMAIIKNGKKLAEFKAKTNTGTISNASEGNKGDYFMKNIDTHPIKIWFTDVYPPIDEQ